MNVTLQADESSVLFSSFICPLDLTPTSLCLPPPAPVPRPALPAHTTHNSARITNSCLPKISQATSLNYVYFRKVAQSGAIGGGRSQDAHSESLGKCCLNISGLGLGSRAGWAVLMSTVGLRDGMFPSGR